MEQGVNMPARERGKWSAEAIRRALKLYAVTDNAWLGERTLTECVEEALAGGTTFVQLRDKHASAEDLRAEAEELLALCRAAGVPFVVNDDVECALAVGADGVHVGQDDMACERARALLGPDAIVGVSTQTVEQARAAEAAGADYLVDDSHPFDTPKPESGTHSKEENRAYSRCGAPTALPAPRRPRPRRCSILSPPITWWKSAATADFSRRGCSCF